VGVRSCYEPAVKLFLLREVIMYQALYRKYRPQTFDDVVGQMAVTQTLKTQLQSGRLSHAYLFTGSRGTGKTSSAKILAKAVNCENPQDGNPCNRCKSCLAIDAGSCMMCWKLMQHPIMAWIMFGIYGMMPFIHRHR